MVNYKGQVRSIVVGGYERSIPAQAKVIQLHEQVDGSSAADGMFDTSDGIIYSVPAGKTLVILGVTLHGKAAAALDVVVISSGDTENAETASLVSIQIPIGNAITEFVLDGSITFASAKFVTINPSTTTLDYITMIGYEL